MVILWFENPRKENIAEHGMHERKLGVAKQKKSLLAKFIGNIWYN